MPRAAVMCAAHLQLSLLIGLALVLAPGGGYAAGDGVEEDSIQEGGRAKEDSFVTLMRTFQFIGRLFKQLSQPQAFQAG